MYRARVRETGMEVAIKMVSEDQTFVLLIVLN